MRRNARVDANQKQIVKALRKAGASVLITSQLKNCFDILVGYNNKNFIMEIKDGEKPPSQQRLTPGEEKFKNEWNGGVYHIVKSVDEALRIILNKRKVQKPKTLIGYISALKMLEAIHIEDLKQGHISTRVKQEVKRIQANLSDKLEQL